MRETEKVEGLRLTFTASPTACSGKPPKLDEPRLGGVRELGQPNSLISDTARLPAQLGPIDLPEVGAREPIQEDDLPWVLVGFQALAHKRL